MRSHPMYSALGPCAASPSYVRPTGPVCGQPGLCAASSALAPRAFDSQPPAPATRPGPAPRPWPPRSSPVPGALSSFWLSPRSHRVRVSGAPPALACAPLIYSRRPRPRAPLLRPGPSPAPQPRPGALSPFWLFPRGQRVGVSGAHPAFASRAFNLQPPALAPRPGPAPRPWPPRSSPPPGAFSRF